MTVVHYETEHGTIGRGIVADMQESPLTGRVMLRIVDSHQEAKDEDAGRWMPASKCWEPEDDGPQTLSCFI